MASLNKLFKTHLAANRQVLILLIFLSFLGFLDATYLTIQHFENAVPPCTLSSCETVLTSKYATVFGIPIALPGALYYLSVFVLSFVLWQNLFKKWQLYVEAVIAGFIALAFLINAFLFSLQAFVIHAFCQYCIANEIITIIMLLLLIYINLFSNRTKVSK